MNMNLLAVLLFIFAFYLPGPASAACTTPAGVEGQMLFNGDFKTLQFCDNTNWIAIGKPLTDCPNVGDLCSNGSYYAGLSPDGNVKMYMADVTTEITGTWNNGTANYTLTGFSSPTDGDGNTAGLIVTDSDSVTGGVQPHDAAAYCDGLSAHGQTNWYLPADLELNLIWNGGTPVGDIKVNGTFYWASTEMGTAQHARVQRFDDGLRGSDPSGTKSFIRAFRCVSKTLAVTGCANPAANAGGIIYNADQRVMQYCDGSTWIAMGPVGGANSFVQISAAAFHTCGIKSDGTAWCWGWGANGLLGNGDLTQQNSPVQISEAGPWASISAGFLHSCGIKSDGTAWCWGAGNQGQLGNGGTAQQNNPVQISEAGPWAGISAGTTHSCGIKSDGTAWCWGRGLSGQLGNGGTAQQNNPVPVSGAGPWAGISAGANHSCGMKQDGTIWCWGQGNNGQLGNGGTAQQNSPVLVSGAGPWTGISAGDFHSCGLKSDNTAWCWGSGNSGQLGNGGTGQQNNPVQISEAGPWASISAGVFNGCGIKSDNTAWCWGSGLFGRLGNGGTGQQNSPVPISEAGPWASIDVGQDHSCAVKQNGTAWCWGSGSFGQLGNGSTVQQNNPDQIPCDSTLRPEGTLLYNADFNVMQYCDGVDWVEIRK